MTSEQEAQVLEMLEAYQNGKRLSELPEVQGTNPFNLICEVLDEDGESKQAALATLLPYLEEECAYGVQIDSSVSATELTRLGNTDLHKSLPIQSRMKGCLLDDEGNVVEYLDPSSWTGHTRDGSRGQVMVEIPMHYRKFATDGTLKKVYLSEYPLPGYTRVPKMYIGAYEAALDRTNLKLASVVNTDAQYRGGNNNSDRDGTYRTMLGMPATLISRTNFRTYARNRNTETTEWNCYTYEAHKALYWLYVVEYANLNSQAGYNAELTSEGFRQGGLGAGVTTINSSNWSSFNSYYPLVPCGTTDKLGNGTGIVSYTVYASDGSELITFDVPRYRGIENPFGHLYKWTDGINICANYDDYNKVYTCDDPSLFSDTGYDGYRYVGNHVKEDGYVKDIIFGEYGDIIATNVDGGSTSYYADYQWYYDCDDDENNILVGVHFGGNAYIGADAGLACGSAFLVPSYAYSYYGSRLCFIPATA